MFQKRPKSPIVDQDFIWVAEYNDGSFFTEHCSHTGQRNKVDHVDRNRLTRFGLVGDGAAVYYEVVGGIFKIIGQMITAKYVVGLKEYKLTNLLQPYNRAFSHKDAEFAFTPDQPGSGFSYITQYNVGYRAYIEHEDVSFHFKVTCQIPRQNRPSIQFALVADKDMDGTLIISRNGREADAIHAPLVAGEGRMINWELRF